MRSRVVASAAVIGIIAMGLSGAVISTANAADSGSTLVDETFANAAVADNRWVGLGDACLTGATGTAPAGGSNLQACDKTQDTQYLRGQENGFLQLTDNSGGRTGNVLFDRAIPSRSGLDISFYQYQFANGSSTGIGPADGIGFFLTDGAYALDKPGPMGSNYGGALGYATIEDQNGLDHGVLGLGLDVYGNYSSQPYVGRQCPANVSNRTQNSVSLRGAGNGKDGYCLEQNKDGNYATGSSLLQTGVPVAGVADANNGTLVRVEISPTTDQKPNPVVTISLNDTPVSTYELSSPLPPTVKLGFASSTGGGHEAHLIRAVKVKTVDPLDAISLVKTVDHSDATGTKQTAFAAGDSIPYSFLVTNTGDEPLHNVTVTDPIDPEDPVKVPDITCPPDKSKLLGAHDSMTCTGTYKSVTAEQAAAGSIDNHARATGQTPDGDPVHSDSDEKAPTYTKGKFAITKNVTGNGASAVDSNASFTGTYSYKAGNYKYCAPNSTAQNSDVSDQYPAKPYGTFTVKNGQTYTSDPIPTGATVTLNEADAKVDGTDWTGSFAPQTLVIGCEGSTVSSVLTNNYVQRPATLTWNKVDADSSATKLDGSEWTLTGPSYPNGITVVDNDGTDSDNANGQFKVANLAWGKYTLKETKAPVGYELNPTAFEATVNNTNLTAAFGDSGNITDPRLKGDVTWKKIDATSGDALAGTGWTLTMPDGTTKKVVTDNGNGDDDSAVGAFKVSNLPWGKYTLSETTVPAGYNKVDDKTFTIDGTEGQTVLNIDLGTLEDTRQPGNASWGKVDPNGKPLAGSEWLLEGSDNYSKTIVDNDKNTDSNDTVGAIQVSDLDWGKYTLKETKAPKGHALSDKTYEATIDGSNLAVTFGDASGIPNSEVPGKLSWSKVNPGGDKLAGSTWTVVGPNGYSKEIADNSEDDQNKADGEFEISGLDWGEYTLTETKAPTGYTPSTNSYKVTIDADNADDGAQFNADNNGNIENKPKPAEVSWNKTDDKGAALAGSEWQLNGPGDYSKSIVDNGDNDSNPQVGAIQVTGLAWGEYTLTETKAPTGYQLDAESRKVTVGATELSESFGDIKNSPIPGTVAWSKVDPDGAALAGSEWKLTGPEGYSTTVVDNGNGDTDSAPGALTVNGLAWGNYTLTETKAPIGYLINTDPHEFAVGAENIDVQVGKLVNAKSKPSLHLVKTSDPASGSTVKPGSKIKYTVIASNTGNVDLTPVTVKDDLSKVLNNATFVAGSATAKIGDTVATAPVLTGTKLNWKGDLAVGESVTLSYTVKVKDGVAGNANLVNVVTGSGNTPTIPGGDVPSNCQPATASSTPGCHTDAHTPKGPNPVTPPEPKPVPPLAVTGASIGGLALGIALLVAGGLFVAARRRKH